MDSVIRKPKKRKSESDIETPSTKKSKLTYNEMVKTALLQTSESEGISLENIYNYISNNYTVNSRYQTWTKSAVTKCISKEEIVPLSDGKLRLSKKEKKKLTKALVKKFQTDYGKGLDGSSDDDDESDDITSLQTEYKKKLHKKVKRRLFSE